jgi:GNAT superfamily N-acetyltransferase
MTVPWLMTRDAFVGDYPVKNPATPAEASEDERQLHREIREARLHILPASIRRLDGYKGYFLADVAADESEACADAGVLLLKRDPEDGKMAVIGGYVGPSLWVHKDSRGMGLGPELVLAKADVVARGMNPVSYTTGGLKAHREAHRLAVQRALRDGYKVPDHVLAADYPEMLPPGRRLSVPAARREGKPGTVPSGPSPTAA